MNILLTGGGTAGHVIPNLAIADAIRAFEPKTKLFYIGSRHGIEKNLVEHAGFSYAGISTGKWRRYFDLRNVIDPFRIVLGIGQAWWVLGKWKPKVIFSKGGFVALPVVLAGWLRRIPIVIHDSDAIPGLTTKLSAPFARTILLAYETAHMELARYEEKIEVVGNPVRLSLFEGDKERARREYGFKNQKPVLLVMGGSSGSEELNTLTHKEKAKWLEHFNVVHIAGARHKELRTKNYVRLPFIEKGMSDLYALADLALTRAGANTLAELHALHIPALLYPLGRNASRGDQMANAKIMSVESHLFQIAEDGPALPQLLSLPLRPDKIKTEVSTEKIAWTLLSFNS